MTHVSFEEIQELLLESAAETVEAHGRARQPAPGAPRHWTDEDWVIAAVGFAADDQDGRLTIVCPRRVARQLQPDPPDGRVCKRTERDVLGEIANMLIGRLKHHLLARGAAITISTPSTGTARNLRPQASGGLFPSCLFLPVGNDKLYLHLQTSADGERRPIARRTPPIVAPVKEGELVFF